MARAKSAKPKAEQATYGWLHNGHAAYQMLVELMKTYYGEKLGIGDVFR